ncbi:type IX secretion system membrane protein PorP/SprF [Marivirga sp. S37H4]|uniref:Type IX secretion system membrane protein PorP/SprF n=1 Tax=Marivirga aurantiaca TaxID=2802615 RepID=A0A934WWW6_9BACT|nr:type IX secretion system membrane protein PorP/SprF [Marivirga aurantiaca]MBK6264361.1 type IX secretion system membrane protein PorP/SprF [Marivirga aurantiaca]
MANSGGKFTKVIVLTALICTSVCLQESKGQQKVQYTQYMFDGALINPAYVGVDEVLSLTFIHRNQWSGVEGAPQSQTLSGHTLFKEKQLGMGLMVNYDVVGIHKAVNISTNYAYHLKVGRDQFLSLGLQAGIHNRNSDYASLLVSSGNDPSLVNIQNSDTYFDLGLGLYYRNPKLHIGFSVPEFIPQKFSINDTTSVQRYQLNQFLFTKYRIVVNDNIDLEPSVLLKYWSGVPLSYDLNLNATFKKVISAGFSYRRSESIDFLLRLQITPQLQFGYSYDYPIGHLARFANVSHEIMARYIFKFKYSDVSSPR